VGEHVRNDTAIAVLERLDESLAQVERDGLAKGPWKKARSWLQTTLAELWRERGAFPGIPAVLAHLGMERAEIAYRTVFRPLERDGKDPCELLFAYLEGRKKPQQQDLQRDFSTAGVEWQDKRERTRDLLRLLLRFDLTKAQVDRVVTAGKRRDAGITADEQALRENPYILVESDLGVEGSSPIRFEAIDHGMLPDKDKLPLLPDSPIARNDRRRLRAVLVRTLKTAAQQGDTFLSLDDALSRAAADLPEARRIDGDPGRVVDEQQWHAPLVTLREDQGGPRLVGLAKLREMESYIAAALEELVQTRYGASGLDWSPYVAAVVGRQTAHHSADRVAAARAGLRRS
jgi:hypothetical protein